MARLYRHFAMTAHHPSPLDRQHMALALEQARLAALAGEVPVGAVVVKNGEVLAVAHNHTVAHHDPTAHAEVLALRLAGQRLGNHRLDGCEMFVTLEPCAMCAQAIAHARLARLVYGAPEPKTGAAGSVVDILGDKRLNPHTAVASGVEGAASAALLQAFFQDRRKAQRAQAQPLRDDALRTPDPTFARWGAAWPAWQGLQDHSRYTSNLAPLNGLRLHHMDRPGSGDGAMYPPWLCLHGPGAWWPQWALWLQQPPGGRRVLVPDLVGHGQSDKPKKARWHDLATHARVLLALLDHLGLNRVELVVAPGQSALARTLHGMAPAKVGWGAREVVPDTTGLPLDWELVPFPDKGHRAALGPWAGE